MDMRYEQFCFTDPVFYDSPSRSQPAHEYFATGRLVPNGWLLHQKETWTVVAPPEVRIPAQGWKIHVAATLDNATNVLDTVWDYCTSRGISFKFLTNRIGLLLRNAKYADRGGSGKFVTIYPSDHDELERTLRELGAALDGSPGPYILSDVRWQDGPLYVRYGGFAERYCRLDDGESTFAIADPDGNLVPDSRNPSFAPPQWVDIPEFLAPSITARTAPETPHEFPFQIERPLHYSNGGGIYLATDTRFGRQVVLREARPHAGVDPTGADAVQRLERERDFLEKLAGTGVAPELYDSFVCWEHHFLVEEYVEGQTLGRAFVARCPVIHPDVTDDDVAEYTRWALDVLDKVAQALRRMHDAGIAFGDLHPHNIMVRPDGEIRFVDFELASYIADQVPSILGAPGYVPADGRTGADVDLYALACLRLAMFLPLTIMLPLDTAKARMLARSVGQRYPVPESMLTEVTEVLHDRRHRSPAPDRPAVLAADIDAGTPDWPALRASMREAILASATPERSERLFPGDIEQFNYSGVGLAYGAAGVLYALAGCGAGRFPEHEQWLLDAVRDGHHEGRVGFYDGLHGIAYALAELGRLDDALDVLERAMATPLEELPVSLFGGLAGVGLNLLHFATLTGDESLRERAVAVGARLTDDRQPFGPGRRLCQGLLHGPSGHALLYVRLFEATGDAQFLDLAEAALRRDLDRCVSVPDGTMQMDESWRVMPYIATGSLGLGMVLHEFLRHREHDEFADAFAQIRRSAEPEFVVCTGLFNGRAGFITFLSWLHAADPATYADVRPLIDRHLRRLAWHIVSYQGNAAFPGDQLLRLSMDLATGSAGVLFALSAALDERGPALPFFGPSSTTAASLTIREGR